MKISKLFSVLASGLLLVVACGKSEKTTAVPTTPDIQATAQHTAETEELKKSEEKLLEQANKMAEEAKKKIAEGEKELEELKKLQETTKPE